MTIQEVKTQVTGYHPEADLRLLDRAFHFAQEAHAGQERQSGEPFIAHPLAVSSILAELELDIITVAAAMLHDVVEDTGVTLDVLRREFGDEVALLVDGVTKLEQLQFKSPVEKQAENLRKMLLAMARDIRVILIKLADRLHNMRTLEHMPADRRQEIAQETLDVYAPLAHRLGISRIQWELEDLSLLYLKPDIYAQLREQIPRKRRDREEFTQEVIRLLAEELENAVIQASIAGRAKHFYSIYRKMQAQEKDVSEIFDLVAVRVIVESVKDCYGVLGIVHTLWKPIPGRFKDYIAMPKSNMYQSLHTSVMGPAGEPFEIQIRTLEMHRTAEYGIAAHWRYKEGDTDEALDEKLSWLRQVLDWQKDLRDAREFMESLKIDLFTDEVFVFTPDGDVIGLPAGSTPIDFAYRIHTEVGHKCIGAKANGRIVSLNYPLANGDIVEILTNAGSRGPSSDWLEICKTSTARSKIRGWFKKQKREENLERGREILAKELRKQQLNSQEVLREEWLKRVCERFSCQGTDELLVSIGYGGISVAQVVNRLKEHYEKEEGTGDSLSLEDLKGQRKSRDHSQGQGVRVRGIENVLVRFSRCCNPVPGDAIHGYITRGRGVSIHRRNCPNMSQYLQEEERIIDVSWENVDANYYPTLIEVTAIDRPGLLSDVAHKVAETRTNILSSTSRTQRDETAIIDLTLEIRDLDQLQFVCKRIEEVQDVLTVERVRH